jgi:hypothetical protein
MGSDMTTFWSLDGVMYGGRLAAVMIHGVLHAADGFCHGDVPGSSKSKRLPAALDSGMAARRRCTATRQHGAKATEGARARGTGGGRCFYGRENPRVARRPVHELKSGSSRTQRELEESTSKSCHSDTTPLMTSSPDKRKKTEWAAVWTSN